jgi:hypothetical protein
MYGPCHLPIMASGVRTKSCKTIVVHDCTVMISYLFDDTSLEAIFSQSYRQRRGYPAEDLKSVPDLHHFLGERISDILRIFFLIPRNAI